MNLEIGYHCSKCRIRGKIFLPPRDPMIGVVEWVNQIVLVAVQRHHLVKKPFCKGDRVSLEIPCPEDAQYVGEDPELIKQRREKSLGQKEKDLQSISYLIGAGIPIVSGTPNTTDGEKDSTSNQ